MSEPLTLDFQGHQARVTRVLPKPPSIFAEKERLTVVVKFEPSFKSTLSVYLVVPARRYSRETFIREVHEALRVWATQEQLLAEARTRREKTEAELKALATTVATDLGLEGPD